MSSLHHSAAWQGIDSLWWWCVSTSSSETVVGCWLVSLLKLKPVITEVLEMEGRSFALERCSLTQ
jgi:hypothetical protein